MRTDDLDADDLIEARLARSDGTSDGRLSPALCEDPVPLGPHRVWSFGCQ